MSATKEAFQVFRDTYPPKQLDLSLLRSRDELLEVPAEQGLELWQDGPLVGDRAARASETPRLIDAQALEGRRLWAVRTSDVVSAEEHCVFASQLALNVIKHSNLTGGRDAHSAGEMLQVSSDTIVLNGSSRRYGPRSEAEMDAVAVAFCRSGYNVWSMGWDTDAGRPAPFVGKTPVQVAP
jgi:hypothetical protein